jgi:hypothetical protein
MLKSEVVAIHMEQKLIDVKVLSSGTLNVDELISLSPLKPFSPEIIDYLNALSEELRKDPLVRQFPDVATFAFYCRKSNLIQLKTRFISDNELRLGRGIVFHIAPSNVPVNFAYSLFCGILSGNVNIVRVPSDNFEQVNIICNAITKLSQSDNYKEINKRIVLVSYDKQGQATSFFSSICDIRVIWGGDATIQQIRGSSIPSRAFDVTFADRYSISVINALQYLSTSKPVQVAQDFYNDTYLFDQNACTSPHLIVWIGTNEIIEKSQDIFWKSLHSVLKEKFARVQPVIAVDKLTTLFTQACQLEGIKKVESEDNLIWRIQIDNLPKNIEDYRCSSGYFTEFKANSLLELAPIINRKYQTLSYFGFNKSELTEMIELLKPAGIDRIVPIGHSSDFSLIWDGYDLVRTLSRFCEIK